MNRAHPGTVHKFQQAAHRLAYRRALQMGHSPFASFFVTPDLFI